MRHDYKLQRHLKKHMQKQMLETYNKMPFVYLGSLFLSDKILDEHLKDLNEVLTNETNEIESIFPFNDFLVFDPSEDKTSPNGGALSVRYIKDDNTWLIAHVQGNKEYVAICELTSRYHGIDTEDNLPRFGVSDANIMVLKHGEGQSFDAKKFIDHEKESAAAELLAHGTKKIVDITLENFMTTVILLFQARNKHLTRVAQRALSKSQRKKANKRNKPIPRTDNQIHYVYLDAPRYNAYPTGENAGTRSRRRGHSVRGHWRRLDNPRFMRHPKYGDRIWIRPFWSGPTEWTVGDTIYTIHDLNQTGTPDDT